jgi:hypothetical protein
MIPLVLRLVEMQVRPNDVPKTVYVLEATFQGSQADLQRWASIPPGRVLLIPPPGREAPGEPYPPRPSDRKGKAPDASEEAEGLMQLWARAKGKIWHHGIPEPQIARWFESNYGVAVGLKDFDPPIPPDKLTAAMLSRFCDSVDRHWW